MSGSKHHSIQALRAVAALTVVLVHASGIWETKPVHIPVITNSASLGVYLFFVISGFIIAERMVHESSLSRYLLKRYLRVLPLSIVATGSAVAISWLLNGNTIFTAHVAYDGSYDPGPFYILQSMFMVPMDDWPYLMVTWSLPFEVIFYAAFGSAALMINQRIGTLLFILGAVWLWAEAFWMGALTDGYPHRSLFLFFAFGLLAREWMRLAHGTLLPACLALLGLAAIVATTEFGFYFGNFYILMTGLGFMGLLVLVMGLERDGKAFSRPGILTWLGDISFSLYLVHLLVINTTAFFFRGTEISSGTAEMLRISTVLGSIVLAAVVFYAIERPVNGIVKRRIARIGRPPTGDLP